MLIGLCDVLLGSKEEINEITVQSEFLIIYYKVTQQETHKNIEVKIRRKFVVV